MRISALESVSGNASLFVRLVVAFPNYRWKGYLLQPDYLSMLQFFGGLSSNSLSQCHLQIHTLAPATPETARLEVNR